MNKRPIQDTSPEESDKPQKMSNNSEMSSAQLTKDDLKSIMSEEMRKIALEFNKMEKTVARTINATEDRIMGAFTEFELKVGKKVSMLEVRIDQLTAENAELKNENGKLSAKVNQIDRDRRRNNIIVTGIAAGTTAEAATAVNKLCASSGETGIAISNIRLIKGKGGPKVLGTCRSHEEKMMIMRKKKDLRGPDGNPVYVNDDLSPEDNEIQFLARKRRNELKAEGKEVQIGFRAIKVDGTWCSYDESAKCFNDPRAKSLEKEKEGM